MLLVYGDSSDFWPHKFLNCSTSFVFMELLGFSTFKIIHLCPEVIYFFLSDLDGFCIFLCLLTLVRTSVTLFNKNGLGRRSCFDPWRKSYQCFIIGLLAVDFPCLTFIMLREFPFSTNLLSISDKMCRNFFKYFFCIIWDYHVVFFSLLH